VLRALPRYAFAAPVKSEYRIRKEPDDEYVSTIEALMHVLGALEGEPARFRALLEPLRTMVDVHIAHREAAPRARYRQRINRPASARLPPAIFARRADLVTLVGEANAWPYRDAATATAAATHIPDELVHLVAERPATGERIDLVCAPRGPLSASTPHHTGLTEATLRAGGRREDALAALAAFLRPTDILCTWGHYGAGLVLGAGGALPEARLDLRVAAQRLIQRKAGALEDYADSLGPMATPWATGRAGARLAMLGHILASWQALPTS
jgi:hypothetical protein